MSKLFGVRSVRDQETEKFGGIVFLSIIIDKRGYVVCSDTVKKRLCKHVPENVCATEHCTLWG